ncbi:hypothetical protein AXG93_21s1000 [Marchantia polymorpha subsp. ruderalis]|uniref:Uncharacterized protein n=1 Tax=Marchantia polymorpha subsp. ruderalis TaxID=1480154 RepID=A0A176WCZ4_MARPO|nr:hypothetical protein AXG93_21s1000 [Marchantia polymorpha subsp. ruderalis]
MARSTQLRMVPLKVPQIGVRAFQNKLSAVKLDFLLWGWNWVCPEMVREWLQERNQPPHEIRPHPQRWQVGFVELALTGIPIHCARILWKATRQHAQEEKEESINHLSPLLINFYRSMGCLKASERVQFPLLSRSNPGRYVKDVEVDIDTDETPTCTPPARPRAEEEPRAVECCGSENGMGRRTRVSEERPLPPPEVG